MRIKQKGGAFILPKGEIRKPNDYYVRIVNYLKAIGSRRFTSAEITAGTDIEQSIVSIFLMRNAERGFLSRTGKYASEYQVVRIPELEKAKGAVAEAVWEIFTKKEENVPLKTGLIIAYVNDGRDPVFREDSIRNAIRRFRKAGALIQTKDGYFLNPNITLRPVAVD